MDPATSAQIVPDSEHKGLVARLPQPLRDYALLARFDRPIGWWLLFWPCAWGLFLGGGTARLPTSATRATHSPVLSSHRITASPGVIRITLPK